MGVVETVRDKCKRCYSCIRNCPAKAIKIVQGQAEVMEERCIGCGNCVKVCAQRAKRIESGIEHTWELLSSGDRVFAILAPSFPAAFHESKPRQLVTALKKLGFAEVLEVAFGADLISREYSRLAKSNAMPVIITSPCPALVSYIEKYYPNLLLFLAPIVSPMMALGRVIKQKYAPDARVVFIGPCIAKKKERSDPKVTGIIDEVLTYQELKAMLKEKQIDIRTQVETDFDGPRPYIGRIFPVSGGLLKTAAIQGDILENDIIVTEGRDRTVEILQRVEEGKVEAKFLDLLFCEGCINGPVMDNTLSVFIRKDIVANYVRSECQRQNVPEVEAEFDCYESVDLHRRFTNENIMLPIPTEEELKEILAKVDKFTEEDELNCGSCGYNTCREKATAVYQGLAELEMCLPYLLNKFQKMNEELLAVQERLVRTARLASMGELAAGVAHEINNPMTGVLTYIKLLLEKMQKDAVPATDLPRFRQYLATMESETFRCSEIVKNLLDFARPTEPVTEPVEVSDIINKTLVLIQHQIKLQNVNMIVELPPMLPKILVDSKQMVQVFLNLFMNSAQAMPNGGTLTIRAYPVDKEPFVTIHVSDTGCGIPKEIIHKIFDPFFTTKSETKGTGLGLSVVYGIVHRHGGSIEVESTVGKGTTFMVKLPVASVQTNPSIKRFSLF